MRSLSGRIIFTDVKGVEIRFFVADENELVQKRHARGVFYEAEELALIEAAFTPGGVFLDVGANIGNHTVYVGKFLKPSRIICIEPNPEAIEILKVNIMLNEVATLTETQHLGVGLYDGSGTASLFQPQKNNLGAMQLRPGSGEIRLHAGDDLLPSSTINFIKIDVEGMELSVLKGLNGLISRCRPTIFVEVDITNLARFEEWVEDNSYSVAATYRRYPWNENFLVAPR